MTELHEAQAQLQTHNDLLLAIVGKKNETNIIAGNSGTTAGGSITNDSSVIKWLAIAIAVIGVTAVVTAFGGKFLATDGDRQIEVDGND